MAELGDAITESDDSTEPQALEEAAADPGGGYDVAGIIGAID